MPTKKLMLSNASLEVLAIVAYKQPISRIDIESIRGVDCKGVIKNLLNKKLIKIGGRDDSLGKALLYHTTDEYLKHFGLTNLSEMPTISEISEIIDSEDNGIINEAL
jgi:segregation and condensation protein B